MTPPLSDLRTTPLSHNEPLTCWDWRGPPPFIRWCKSSLLWLSFSGVWVSLWANPRHVVPLKHLGWKAPESTAPHLMASALIYDLSISIPALPRSRPPSSPTGLSCVKSVRSRRLCYYTGEAASQKIPPSRERGVRCVRLGLVNMVWNVSSVVSELHNTTVENGGKKNRHEKWRPTIRWNDKCGRYQISPVGRPGAVCNGFFWQIQIAFNLGGWPEGWYCPVKEIDLDSDLQTDGDRKGIEKVNTSLNCLHFLVCLFFEKTVKLRRQNWVCN